MNPVIDYATTGLDIRQAKVEHAKRQAGDPDRTDYILWDGIRVKTADWWDVPITGIMRIEFLSSDSSVDQGVDIKIEDGWLELQNKDHVSILRTWKNEKYEDSVEYRYFSQSKKNLHMECIQDDLSCWSVS
jgi:hypothetical protein